MDITKSCQSMPQVILYQGASSWSCTLEAQDYQASKSEPNHGSSEESKMLGQSECVC